MPEQFVLGEMKLWDLGSVKSDYMKYIKQQRSLFGSECGNGSCQRYTLNDLLIQQLVMNFGASLLSC